MPSPSLSCNLATKIAWLEGYSVVSECTGESYCEILNPNRSPNLRERIKYDPIGRPGIQAELLKKYKVDLDWRRDGSVNMDIFRFDSDLPLFMVEASEKSSDHGGCFGTTLLTVILEAQK